MMMITMMTMMTIVMTMIMYSAENPNRPLSRRLDRCDLLIQNNEFKHVGLLPIVTIGSRMHISEEDWDISITSKSVSVPTITTSFLSVCAEVSAVETMR